MKKQEKIFEAQNLSAKIKDAKSIALTNYKGVNTSLLNSVRSKVKEAGGEVQIVKNNLFARALQENKYKINKSNFEGTTLAVFGNSDEVAPIKALAALSKANNDLLSFKMGFMGNTILTIDDLKKFATMPTKLELQAKLVGMLAGPTQRLVYTLNGNIQKLVIALGAIRDQKH